MSRSGLSDDGDGDNWSMIRWRGMIASATRGKRGQSFFRDLLVALDAMPDKRLIRQEYEAAGQFCTLGVIAHAKGITTEHLDPDDASAEIIAGDLNIAGPLAREVVWMNDEAGPPAKLIDGKWTYCPETPEERWTRIRAWVASQIKPVAA